MRGARAQQNMKGGPCCFGADKITRKNRYRCLLLDKFYGVTVVTLANKCQRTNPRRETFPRFRLETDAVKKLRGHFENHAPPRSIERRGSF